MDTNEWLNFIKTELAELGFSNTNFENSTLSYLINLQKIAKNDSTTMIIMHEKICQLIKCIPISVITDKDFDKEETIYAANTNEKIWRCSKYPYLYKTSDGKYWNDRAIVYTEDYNSKNEFYMYQGKYSSKQEIFLPYIIDQKKEIFKHYE